MGERKLQPGLTVPPMVPDPLTMEERVIRKKAKLPTELPASLQDAIQSKTRTAATAGQQLEAFDPDYAGWGWNGLGKWVQGLAENYPQMTENVGKFLGSDRIKDARYGKLFFDQQTRVLKQFATSVEKGRVSDVDWKLLQETDVGPGDDPGNVAIKLWVQRQAGLHDLASEIYAARAAGVPEGAVMQAVGSEQVYRMAVEAGPWDPRTSLLQQAIGRFKEGGIEGLQGEKESAEPVDEDTVF